MYIGLKNIQRLFASHETLLIHSDELHCLTGWDKLSEETAALPLDPHHLYVCSYDSSLIPMDPETCIHLICYVRTLPDANDSGNPENADTLRNLAAHFPASASILLVRCNEPKEIYAKLQQFFNHQCGLAMYGQTLLDFLAFDDNLQNAVEYSYHVFQNPIFVFDSGYNLIAATWNAIDQLQLHDEVITEKHFTKRAFSMANRLNHIHSKILQSELPIRAYNEELGYEQLYCAINTQKDLGHIVISSIQKPFEDADSEFLLLLKKYINEQMKKDSFIRDSRGYQYEFFLKDLLDRKIAVQHAAGAQFNYITENFGKSMVCMVIELTKNTRTVNSPAIRNMLESRFPNIKTLLYNGQLIAILPIPSLQHIPEEYIQNAAAFCEVEELYAGMSNPFSDILQLEEYYNQALRAMELGCSVKNDPSLFCYADYYLDHLKNVFTQKESSAVFCHPKMKCLMDYDEKNHSELAFTLYMYLTHDCNLQSTAEAMDMHRSSLVYRFKKINTLLGNDFGSARDRIYMILSYEFRK